MKALNQNEREQFEALKRTVLYQRHEIHVLQTVGHERNLELDALHHVWCDGGCLNGVHRYEDHGPVTEELVQEVERQAVRLRKWFNSASFRIKTSRGDPEALAALKKKVA